jgi:acetolactate synthase-1/2/3 large subunit
MKGGADGRHEAAGAALFPRLAALGIEHVFVNSGTDFPPIIEGLARAAVEGRALPRAIVIPHEHAAMGMAHGHWLMTGRPQAVMLHTNVGLANGVIGAINAACDGVPILLMSGRTPVTEAGRFGSRTVPIGWGQEMRDQAALVRECCKWDYELRFPEQLVPALDRACAIATSTPAGPVYLALPREVLCEAAAVSTAPPSLAPSRAGPDPEAVAQAARWLAAAERPLIVAQRGVGAEPTFRAFGAWVEALGLPVSSYWQQRLAVATDHPCHVGADPGAWLAEADLVVVIDSLAPWSPDRHRLAEGARVVQIGPDPLFARVPVRGFRADVTIAADPDLALPALIAAVDVLPGDPGLPARRRRRLARRPVEECEGENGPGITRAAASRALSEALEGRASSVFNELGTLLGPLARRDRLSWFDGPHSGGLGWGVPAALGARLADTGRTIVATVGDGSYIFANPVACHQIAEALDLPMLVVVLNNGEWSAVRQSVAGLYPDGHAVRVNVMPLTSLAPSPDFAQVAAASRAWSRRVETLDALRDGLREALDAVDGGRAALLDVATRPD